MKLESVKCLYDLIEHFINFFVILFKLVHESHLIFIHILERLFIIPLLILPGLRLYFLSRFKYHLIF